MNKKRLYAIKIEYIDFDNKHHTHTTKWYEDSDEAWDEADNWSLDADYIEARSSLIYKDIDL